MTTVAGMMRKLESFDLLNEIRLILEKNKNVLKESEKMQWKTGERSTGAPFGKYKSGKYALMKNKMNPLPRVGNMDLILTAKTIDSLTVDVISDALVYNLASDEHDLVARFGENILGMNTKSRKAFIEVILLPELVKAIKNKMAA